MKLFFCVVIIGALFLQTYCEEPRIGIQPEPKNGKVGNQTAELGCFESINQNSEEVLNLRNSKLPTTRAGKCLYECMLRSSEIVYGDGLIDVKKITAIFEDLQVDKNSIKTFVDILKRCEGHKQGSTGDVCETAGELLECAVQEGGKHFWTPESVIELLRSPYYRAKKSLDVFNSL